MRLFDINLAAFRKRYPELVNSLERAGLDKCKVETAKNGTPTLKVQFKDREVYLHSVYDPQREASRWAGEIDLNPGDLLVVFGFGLGYHILELFKIAPPDVKIIVIEPNVSFLYQAFCYLPLDKLISSENLHLVLGNDVPALTGIFMRLVDLYRLDKVKTAAYLPLLRTYPDAFHPYEQALFDQLLIRYANISTVVYFSFQWTKNFFANLKETMLSPGVHTLFDKLTNKPAILVSTGPSLKKNMHFLKKAKNKAFILCVGSALRVLLSEGILPDAVISIDGSEANYKHFQNLPPHCIPLIFDPIVHHGIIEEYQGPKFAAVCNDLVFKWADFFLPESKGHLKIGPSVANISLDLLCKTGANPIIFVGQDLAYTNGVSHASGTSHAKIKTIEDLRNEKKYLEVEGIEGEKVVTDRGFYTFIKWFENYIANCSEITFINATEGGAKIPGTRNLPLSDAIDRYCTADVNIEKMLSDIQDNYQKPRQSEMDKVAGNLRETREQVIKIKKSAKRGWEKAENLVALYNKKTADIKKVNKILRSLDQVDREIKENQQGTEIAILLFQPFLKGLRQFSDQAGTAENEREKGRRISQESVLLYSGIYRVADTAEQFIGDAVRKFEDSSQNI